MTNITIYDTDLNAARDLSRAIVARSCLNTTSSRQLRI